MYLVLRAFCNSVVFLILVRLDCENFIYCTCKVSYSEPNKSGEAFPDVPADRSSGAVDSAIMVQGKLYTGVEDPHTFLRLIISCFKIHHSARNGAESQEFIVIYCPKVKPTRGQFFSSAVTGIYDLADSEVKH